MIILVGNLAAGLALELASSFVFGVLFAELELSMRREKAANGNVGLEGWYGKRGRQAG